MFGRKNWSPSGKHVYVTGGSQGLGLAVAILLVQQGAHVSIVARNVEKLEKALETLEEHRQAPDQNLFTYSFSLGTSKDATEALEAVCAPYGGRAPDAVLACAGTAKPGFLLELTDEDMESGMVQGYWVQAWTARAAAKKMVRDGVKGKILFVSSILGYMSFLGYASYTPPKHALRGLADTLASELALYDIDVHIFFPTTMYTPGYDEENKTKPKVVRDIEGDEGVTAEVAAAAMLQGVQKGEAHITCDFATSLFRASTRGATSGNNFILDRLLDVIAWIVIPVWRASVSKRVRSHQAEHRKYLHERGFFS
ncbi:3-ketodihydrosphingosine reductase TSC10 [Mycena kentingensis (nom. inval.)]|nr:3-ketodihydrosphingosine reductase TSC10 [Mycena kentingensis (nom. inval.)]